MKKLLYLFLFLTLILIGCSESVVDKNNGDTTIEDNTPINPPTITFKVREVWQSKLSWNRDNLTFTYNREMCSVTENTLYPYSYSDLTGFETYIWNHFGIDTLVIDISTHPSEPAAKFFDFNISDRLDIIWGGRGKRHPKKIGHIEFIGFNSESRLLLEHHLMDTEIINGERYAQIDYFSSNLSEEFIESITYDGRHYNYYICEPKKVFHKKDYESTIISITVPEDEFNSALNIGDTIGGSTGNKTLGEGWGPQFKYLYYIIDKE